MKFTSGILAGELSGKAGNMVASRNRYGGYFRAMVIPVNPNSPRQAAIRNAFSQLTAHWNQSIDDDARSGWNTYASNTPLSGNNGVAQVVTGFNMFIRSNTARIAAGLAILDDAPALYTLPETDESLAFTASEASQQLSITFDNDLPWAKEVGGKLLIYMGKPQVNNRNFFGGPWAFAGKVDGAVSPPTSPATIDVPEAITEGQKLWIYARVLRTDGRLSGTFRAGPVAVGA